MLKNYLLTWIEICQRWFQFVYANFGFRLQWSYGVLCDRHFDVGEVKGTHRLPWKRHANIAAENPSTHHPAWALFKGCYRDQRENFQSLQAVSCWLLSHWRLVILHSIYMCSLFFFSVVSFIPHIYVYFHSSSVLCPVVFWGFRQSAIETALPCNINNPTLNM